MVRKAMYDRAGCENAGMVRDSITRHIMLR